MTIHIGAVTTLASKLDLFFKDGEFNINLHHLKFAWACGALFSVIMSFVTTTSAWQDAGWIRHLDPRHYTSAWAMHRLEAYRIQAWQSLRKEGVIFILQSGLLWIRFWSLWWPDPGSHDFAARWATDGTILTGLQLLLAYDCYLDWRDRRRLIEQIKEEDSEHITDEDSRS